MLHAVRTPLAVSLLVMMMPYLRCLTRSTGCTGASSRDRGSTWFTEVGQHNHGVWQYNHWMQQYKVTQQLSTGGSTGGSTPCTCLVLCVPSPADLSPLNVSISWPDWPPEASSTDDEEDGRGSGRDHGYGDGSAAAAAGLPRAMIYDFGFSQVGRSDC